MIVESLVVGFHVHMGSGGVPLLRLHLLETVDVHDSRWLRPRILVIDGRAQCNGGGREEGENAREMHLEGLLTEGPGDDEMRQKRS